MIKIGFLGSLFSKQFKSVDFEELMEMSKLKNKVQFIDVRTKQEYKQGHGIMFNKNIDFNQSRTNTRLFESLKKNKPVVVICASGIRSGATCRMLVKLGFEDVSNFKRGYNAYKGKVVR